MDGDSQDVGPMGVGLLFIGGAIALVFMTLFVFALAYVWMAGTLISLRNWKRKRKWIIALAPPAVGIGLYFYAIWSFVQSQIG